MRLLALQVSSLADLVASGRLAGIGRVFDDAGELRPERLDERDPPRRRITSAEEALADYEASLSERDGVLELGFGRKDPHVVGGISLWGAGIDADPPSEHEVSMAVDEEWLREKANRESMARTLRGIAEVTDAHLGYARFHQPYYKQVVPMVNVPRLEAGERTPFWGMGPAAERELGHIHWLNYFGPSFVEHWGRERLEGLGVRQEWTANGGVVVWATETPFVLDPGVARTTDYAFKRPFFERLGIDTFVHEDHRPGAPGQYVPTFADHRRHARRARAPAPVQPEARPAPPLPEPPAPPPRAAVVEAVAALRRVGFFAADLRSDHDLAAHLAAEHEELCGEPLERPGPALDWRVAAYDEARVWWEDTEADVLAGNDAYRQVIPAWAAVSRGAFAPEEVTEVWETPQGPVRVEVSLAGRRHTLSPRVVDDYYDLGVVTQINDLLELGSPRFAVVEQFDQTAVVLALTDDERRFLETERGWRFAEVSARPR